MKLLNSKKSFLLTLVFVIGILCISKVITLFIADITMKKAKDFMISYDYQNSLILMNRAIVLNSKEPYYFKNRAHVYAELALQESFESKKNYYKNISLENLNEGYNLNPKNLKFLRDSIYVYYLLSKNDSFLSNEVLQTRNYFYFLKTEYSTDVGTLVDVAMYEKKLNLLADYNQTITQIIKLRPDLLNWYPEL